MFLANVKLCGKAHGLHDYILLERTVRFVKSNISFVNPLWFAKVLLSARLQLSGKEID